MEDGAEAVVGIAGEEMMVHFEDSGDVKFISFIKKLFYLL